MLRTISLILTISLLILTACTGGKDDTMRFTGRGDVVIMTLDPGHFHAALVQKTMYDQVNPTVYIFAPDGPDVDDHLRIINGYNARAENPTSWSSRVYRGSDFLEKMVIDKPGNVAIMAGNNRNKTAYIKKAVDAGIHVLADKPMCINQPGFELLKQAFASATQQDVLLYDIMTERYEITTILQKELALLPEVFGELVPGTPDEPTVTKESVHHFFKYVSGQPIKRPAWYFDTTQQGEGIVDVATHLVDLIQWECFPEQILDCADIEIVRARRWPTAVNLAQFEAVTQLSEFPDYLTPFIKDGVLSVHSNGEFVYKLKGVHAKVSVIWNYQAPPGAGDTHYSIMRGSKANIVIRQGEEQNYKPELYVEEVQRDPAFGSTLRAAVTKIAQTYPGVTVAAESGVWHVSIPQSYRVGHEAHFVQVASKFLGYLVDGKLPDWEVPNMIAKYYTTTSALQLALQ